MSVSLSYFAQMFLSILMFAQDVRTLSLKARNGGE